MLDIFGRFVDWLSSVASYSASIPDSSNQWHTAPDYSVPDLDFSDSDPFPESFSSFD